MIPQEHALPPFAREEGSGPNEPSEGAKADPHAARTRSMGPRTRGLARYLHRSRGWLTKQVGTTKAFGVALLMTLVVFLLGLACISRRGQAGARSSRIETQ
jgi:hypothetical protein